MTTSFGLKRRMPSRASPEFYQNPAALIHFQRTDTLGRQAGLNIPDDSPALRA